LFSDDIVDRQVKQQDIVGPANWKQIAPGSTTEDLCRDPAHWAS
jgi:hypothetical protein